MPTYCINFGITFMKKSLTLFCLLITAVSFAQEGDQCSLVLRGKVVHAEHQEPIEGATVWVEEMDNGVRSDIKGNFRLTNLCSNTVYSLTIQYLGHISLREEVVLTGNTSLTFRLVEQDILIEGVEVHGHRDAVITTSTVSSLSGRALEEIRGATLGEALKRISGVTTYSTGSNVSKPVIHGMHSNRIMILNNGVRQEGQQWGTEHAPEIDPFMADEIAVVKGAETVRYGPEAMGGVILVNPPKLPTTKTLRGEIYLIGASNGRMGNTSVNLTGGSGRIKGLGYRLQASGKAAGNIKSPDYYQANTGLRELNFSTEVGYNIKKLGTEIFYSRFQTTLGILRDAHTGNLSDLNAIITNGRPFRDPDFTYEITSPRQEVSHDLFKAKIHYHYDNGDNLNIQYGFQRNQRREYDRRRGDLNGRPSLDLELFTNTLDVSYEHFTRKNWNGSVGMSFIQQANNNIPGTGVTPLIPNYDMANLGAFVMEKFTSGRLELEAGLRYDYRKVAVARFVQRNELEEREFLFNNFSAFIGAHYSLSPEVSFNTNLGSAWRPPNINEQFSQGLHHGTAAIEIGNPDFISEQALKWVNTLTVTESKFRGELTGYAHRINNYIYLAPTPEQIVSLRGTFNVFEYRQTDAMIWGMDLSVAYEINENLEWFTRASLIRAKNLIENSYLPFIPSDRTENGLTWKKSRIGTFSENRFSISNQWVARQHREPGFDLAPAPPGYNIWNINLTTILPIQNKRLRTGLTVNNVLNKSYKDYMNRFRYFTHEMGTNVIINLNYKF